MKACGGAAKTPVEIEFERGKEPLEADVAADISGNVIFRGQVCRTQRGGETLPGRPSGGGHLRCLKLCNSNSK